MLKTFSARIAARTCLIALCFFIISLLTAGYALATSNIVFILDASGSMNGNIGNETKMTAAKRVLSDLLNELPADAQVGLMAYGHTVSKEKAGACEDIAILSPIGQETPQALAKKVNALQPMGMTPIASSLIKSVEAFRGVQGGNNHVVLISDGLETCGRDPCKAAKALTEANINARVHVIGFDVGAKEAAELACIPKMGNGKYFRANNIEELKLAIAEIKKVTEVAEVIEEPKVEEPKPKTPEYKVVWRDDFDGDDLADNWEILNPDPDSFIVEEGNLLIITKKHSAKMNFSHEKFPNLFRLTDSLPKGDWQLTAKINIELHGGVESFYLGVMDGNDKWLVAALEGWHGHGSSHPYLNVVARKNSKGKITKTQKNMINPRTWSKWPNVVEFVSTYPVYVRIDKQGRHYTVSMKLDAPEDLIKKAPGQFGSVQSGWIVLDSLTMLRPPKNIVTGFSFWQRGEGESIVKIDHMELKAVSSE